MGRMPALSAGPGLTAFATAGFDIGFEAAPYLLRRLGGLMFGVDAAGGSRHRAFRIGVPARFPAGRPAAPHGGKARGCFPSGNRGGRGIAHAMGKG